MAYACNNSPWHYRHLVSIVRSLQQFIQIPHDLLERLAHQVQRTIRKNDGIFLILAVVSLGHRGILELDAIGVVAALRSGGDESPVLRGRRRGSSIVCWCM